MTVEVTLLKCKYDGSVKRERTGTLLETRGDWLVVLYIPGVHVHRKHGEIVNTDSGIHLFYLNTRLPLTAMNYFRELTHTGSYVDAALPATFVSDTARYVDLELDIVAEPGEEPYVKDIRDFELQRQRLNYPPEVSAAAWEGIRIGSELLGRREFPFDGSAEPMLQAVLAAGVGGAR